MDGDPNQENVVQKPCFSIELRQLFRPQAHPFPPSSLDRRSIEFIVSPKKVVGCRGGNQNVEWDSLTFGELILDDSLP